MVRSKLVRISEVSFPKYYSIDFIRYILGNLEITLMENVWQVGLA
jgi:hypothetical protein